MDSIFDVLVRGFSRFALELHEKPSATPRQMERARHLVLTLSLFVGAGITREVLRRVGLRPLAPEAALWLLVSGATLAAILSGLRPRF